MIISCLQGFHGRLYEWKLRWKHIFELKKQIQTLDGNTLLFIMTPVHGNIGDQAIAKATIDMLSEMNLEYIEVTSADLMMLNKIRSIHVLNGKRILVHGGGYLGTLWPELEELFRKILLKTPDSKVLCFPNTVYYDNTINGKKKLKESINIYNKHQDLKICMREIFSYEMVRSLYNDVVLIPDMVLSVDESIEDSERSGCLICFRNDIEKTLTPNEIKYVKSELNSLFNGNVRITDIDELDYIPIAHRNAAIKEKIDEFKSAELIVTDRLHGMIFSAITGTPCIVLESKSHKIRGTYEWIKDLNYIILANKDDSISNLYNRIPKQRFHYQNEKLQPYYAKLKEYIIDITQ